MARQGMEDSNFSALKYSIGLMAGVMSKDAFLGVELIDIIIIHGRCNNWQRREISGGKLKGKLVFRCM